MVAQVTAHHDKGVRGGIASAGSASQPSDVTNTVTWRVEQVERAIAKEVEGRKRASSQPIFGKRDLSNLAAADVLFRDGCIRTGGVAWSNSIFETRPHNKLGAGRECGGVADVVKVIVAGDVDANFSVLSWLFFYGLKSGRSLTSR